MIKYILKTTDDFLYARVKSTFERLEEAYNNRDIKITLVKELKNFEFEPLMVTGSGDSTFEKDLKFKLKIMLGIFFVVVPFLGFAFISNIFTLGCMYPFILTFIIAILAASRMDEIVKRYVATRKDSFDKDSMIENIDVSKSRKKIYLAGPDVFKADAKTLSLELKSLCEKYGFIGMFPLDNEIDDADENIALKIFKANKIMIDNADIVIANLNPFRGKEPDSGTVWEVGYSVAKGKKVYGYMSDKRAYVDRFDESEKIKRGDMFFDQNGDVIEDFSLETNLMISCSVESIESNLEEVLKKIPS